MTKTKATELSVETSTNTPTPPTASSPKRFTLESLEAKSGHPAYVLAAVRAAKQWLPGQELTQAQFSEAVSATLGSVI